MEHFKVMQEWCKKIGIKMTHFPWSCHIYVISLCCKINLCLFESSLQEVEEEEEEEEDQDESRDTFDMEISITDPHKIGKVFFSSKVKTNYVAVVPFTVSESGFFKSHILGYNVYLLYLLQ